MTKTRLNIPWGVAIKAGIHAVTRRKRLHFKKPRGKESPGDIASIAPVIPVGRGGGGGGVDIIRHHIPVHP